MKRFHVHVSVDDIEQSIRFYSTLFGCAPAKRLDDYAKWMLEDPRVNFAISRRGEKTGLDHLGLQVESDSELAELRAQHEAAGSAILDEVDTACCYARSDKHWITDPTGIAWETFHTLADIPTFNGTPAPAKKKMHLPLQAVVQADAGACCAPGTSCGPRPA
jgi:catechol 2,3-dioxygenase-like lactoylglutathione lyase family enzyme